ncbi:MAG: hypothetical protein QM564_06820 [Bergeyella sp.]
MNENKTALLKIFSIVLKDRSKSEPQYQSISPDMVKFFTRKELIEIINHIYDDDVPSEYNLVEMENNELLQLIGDDFSIISYVINRWSKDVSKLPTLQEWMDSKVHSAPETEKQESPDTTSKEIISELPKEKTLEEKSEDKPKEAKLDSKPASKKLTIEKANNV